MKAIIISVVAILLLIAYFGVIYFVLELAKACCIKESEGNDADEEIDRE